MVNIAVFVSGSGTNLQAIIDAYKENQINGSIKLVVSNRRKAYGLERARLAGIKAEWIKDEDIIKVHIHTLTPGDVFNIAQQYGEFIKIKVENMTIQHNELEEVEHVEEGQCACGEVHRKAPVKPEKRSKYAVVSVATGEGLIKTFKEMGVDYVVSGGQSMNPSTEDFINGFDTLNADNIIVFPNNKNIIMAAEQAANLSQDVQVRVVASRTIPQGIASLMAYDADGDVDENAEAMADAMQQVRSAEVTYAVRDTSIDAFEIKEGQLLGIVEGKIKAVGDDMQQLICDALEEMDMENAELATLYYGEGVTEDDANQLLAYLEEHYPDVEFELYLGAQAVYSYLISVE